MSGPKRISLNCQRCGRFVRREDGHVVYDDYAGGWEADPYCGPGRGCAKEAAS